VHRSGTVRALRLYLRTKTSSPTRYAFSELLQALLAWIPSIVGIGLRGICYKLVLRAQGIPAIEDHVRLHRTEDIVLGQGVYLDAHVVLHGGPGGLVLGDGVAVMHGCHLNVHNFRGLPGAGIHIGRRTYIGDGTIMRGQGGIHVGDNVLFGPRVLVMAVEHVFGDAQKAIMDQGITARGIRIEDDCWIGAGATLLDGVSVGRGSVIGAGALVSRSVPPHSVAVGVPARVTRNLVTDPITTADAPVYFGGLDEL
jgi:acetyltransferase-like isoleucine patch superfamily enzyme